MKKAKKAAKMFLLVIDKKKNRVLKFWLGSDLLDKRHLARILKKIETLEKRYPLPLYEVVFGTAPDADAEAVKKAFPDVTGWDKVSVSSFKL
ncbi:MAG: hypothetical protein UX07_C0031G0001 [Parcubacteria group bacterium GW2011_GWA2_45_30]|nr:MAG: hypothetical protein UX07_C0031G0001 [Parcubacteria group bacterium GW2011_GWA2_45_30]